MTDFDWRGLADTLGTLLTTWGLKVVGAIALLIIGRTLRFLQHWVKPFLQLWR